MAASDENANAVLQGMARHINCLGEENKMARRRALESIRKDTIGRKPALNRDEMKPIVNEILKPILREFSDPVEKCRELSIEIMRGFLKTVDCPDDYLPYLVPIVVQRLGQQDIIEPSEEIRLQLMELLVEVLECSGKKMAVYLDDLIKILQRTIVDPYPEVKKTSCQCSSLLAKTIPQYFHAQSDSLIKPLLISISHQHSKVRALVVYTIGDVIQNGDNKSVDTVVSHLAQRLFDQTPAVRMAVTKVVGHWMLDLCDRYSFWHKLMPLLLTSLSDEQPEIVETADSLWHDIGLRFEKENEDDLKDKMNFERGKPQHYPEGVERPNLGCRTLMFRNMSKFLPGLLRDIQDWVADNRKKSAGLLFHVLLNAEEYITQHMEMLVTGMVKAAGDEEKAVVQDIQKAAVLVGYFVEVDVWCKLILHKVQTSQSFTSILVLSAVVRGTQASNLKPYLQKILDVLNIPEVCQSVQIPVQQQLLSCVEALMSVCQSDLTSDPGVAQSVFNLLHSVLAVQQGEVIADKVYQLLGELAKLDGLENQRDLYKTYTKPLLDSFQDSYQLWTTHSVERFIFDSLVIEAGPVVGELLDVIMPILTANFHPDKDPEVRLKFFALLSRLMMTSKDTLDSTDKFTDFAELVVTQMILPNCVWKAGRVAAATRTTAVSCAWALLQSGVLSAEKLEPILDKFLTQMLACMDDDNKGTRLVACRVMTRTFELAGSKADQDRLHNMYVDLLKRLDDSSDEVRVTVARTFLSYLSCFEQKYDASLYRAHLDAMYKGLLVHLDDPDEKIQEAILDVLKKAGSLMPGMLIQEVQTAKHKHRSKKYCDDLVSYLEKLSTASS